MNKIQVTQEYYATEQLDLSYTDRFKTKRQETLNTEVANELHTERSHNTVGPRLSYLQYRNYNAVVESKKKFKLGIKKVINRNLTKKVFDTNQVMEYIKQSKRMSVMPGKGINPQLLQEKLTSDHLSPRHIQRHLTSSDLLKEVIRVTNECIGFLRIQLYLKQSYYRGE